MRFAEVNILGVYVAPIVPLMLLAWVAMMPLRWVSNRVGLLRHVWHPALFSLSVYIIVLAVVVQITAAIR